MNKHSGETEKLFEEIKQVAQQGLGYTRRSVVAGHRPVPGYVIESEIYRGGQGVVFRAMQESTRRTVAVKFILQGSFSTERQKFRFGREIDLASRLNHPNIVTIFEGGFAHNQPYYAMEYVDGRPLNQVHWEEKRSRGQRQKLVGLFLKICEAVGYAHTRGIVHRDLKPANILVDHAGQPHILDFGLAKLINSSENDQSVPLTLTGEFVGTLAYASPEQAKASSELTDTRSDVYSLGVVFFEMLTGEMPYDVSGSLYDIIGNISAAEPKRILPRASGVDEDLETILLKALAKDPERRYQNAALLADDLKLYLSREPILARRDSSWYVFKKLMTRNKRTVSAAVSFVALLIVALIATSWFYFQAVGDRNIANKARQEEQEQRRIAEREAAEAQVARKLEQTAREEAEFRTYVAHLSASESSIRTFDVADALRNLSNAPEKHRGFDWWYLLGRIDLSELSLGGREAMQDLSFTGDYRTVDFSPDGRWLAAGNATGMVLLWRLGTQRIAAHWDAGTSIQRLRFHPDGSKFAVGLSSGDALLFEINTESKNNVLLEATKVRYSTEGLRLHALEFSPKGELLIVGCGTYPGAGRVMVFETDSGKLQRSLDGHDNPVWSLAVSRDGRLMASADNEIRIWNLQSGDLQGELAGHPNWVWDLAFHPESKQLASCALEQEVRIWDVESGQQQRALAGHTSFVNALEYSDDGTQLVTVSEDRTIRLWDTSGYMAAGVKWGHVAGIVDVAFGPDSQIATSGTMCVKLWKAQPQNEKVFGGGHFRRITAMDIGPDSRHILASDDRGVVVEWNLETGRQSRITVRPPKVDCAVRSITYSPSGEYAAWSNDDGKIHVFEFETRKTRVLNGHTIRTNSVAISRDGNSLYSASEDQTVLRWDVGVQTSRIFCRNDNAIRNLQMSPNGTWLATTDKRGIKLWEIGTGNQVADIPVQPGNAEEYIKIAFHTNSSQIAATLPPHEVGIWSVPKGHEIMRLSDNLQNVQSLAWSPDGKRLATATRNGTVKIWDSQWYQPVLTLRGFSGYCETIVFSPDGLRLVGGMYDGSIRVWDSLAPERRHQSNAD